MGRLAGDGGEEHSWRRDHRDKGWMQVGYSVGMCMIHMAQSFWEEKLESGGLAWGNRRALCLQFAKAKLVYVT